MRRRAQERQIRIALAFLPVALFAAAPSGESVYRTRCAACHDQTSPRIPARESLQKMAPARILSALDAGAMMSIAFTMPREERTAVASWLGTGGPVRGPSAASFCADRQVRISAAPKSSWNGWSPGLNNARFQSGELNVEQVRSLKLRWAFGFEGDASAFAPITVVDGHLFVGSASGLVHAMRAESGCLEWVFQAGSSVRSAIAVAHQGSQHLLLFGDMTGSFYAVGAETGKLLWKVTVEKHESTRLTGAPVVYRDAVFVPVASWEETRASDAAYPCCTFRGSVVALRIRDGKQLWKTWMTGEPRETGKSARGVPQYGPSGVGVWSAPTLDVKRSLLYVTTGDNYSSPATERSDAVVALRLDNGHVAWARQVTAGDAFNGSCMGDRANCPPEPGPDFDFASSAILATDPDGRELLLAGQKSGVVYALDPAKKGAVVWQKRVGEGGINGGVQWGMAADGQRVYAAVSDVARAPQSDPLSPRRYVLDRSAGGGLTALRVRDGNEAWHHTPQPCPEGSVAGCSPAQPGAVSAVPGVVFATSMDGHVRAHSAEDGRVLWEFNTMREFTTVNHVPAHGGSLDGPGAVIANGMLFLSSGYPRNGGVPGNVLLAFGPE